MAAGYFRKLLADAKIMDIEVRSAGVMTATGLRASQEAIQIMQNEGVDLTRHRSSQLTPEIVRKADLILGMTPLHVQEALRMDKDARDKCYLLKEYSGSDLDKIQIDDPMGATLEVFKKCFREIRDAVDMLMETSFVGAKKRSRPADSGGGAKSSKKSQATKTAKTKPPRQASKKAAPAKKSKPTKKAPKSVAPKKKSASRVSGKKK